MKILFAASEAFPFAKSGGLGDVIGSLPMALQKENVDVRVILPRYVDIPQQYRDGMNEISRVNVLVGWRNQECVIHSLQYNNVTFYFLGNDYYFDRPGLYGYYDEAERFAFFCRGVLEVLPYIGFQPDVIHCHDWHTGMISVLLEANFRHNPYYSSIKTVFSIHNLKFQGIFSKDILGELLGLNEGYFTQEGVEFYDAVSFMKGGLTFSERITTVSPTYAEEIQTDFFGEKLDGLLRKRRDHLQGILNGIDYDVFNPKTDHRIIPFEEGCINKKASNKLKLQEELGLHMDENIPMMAIITRLTPQKGIDLVEHVLEEILELDLQLVVLGTGTLEYEELFRRIASRYPNKVSANIKFDNDLANRIYAASDMFLMPSLFEPCGIGQLIAMRYGSIPIVRETGGLKDTVQPYNEFNGEGNGFSFSNYNAHDMLHTIRRAYGFYRDKNVWNKLIDNAMKTDCSWNNSAKQYVNLYRNLLDL